MSFRSILFGESEVHADLDAQEAPEFFHDLNLDQVVQSITAGRNEYRLMPFFHIPLHEVQWIDYRHEVFRALEDHGLLGSVHSFAQGMRRVRAHLDQAEKLYYKHQKESWFLDAVSIYCGVLGRLATDLSAANPKSRGLRAFHEFLTNHLQSGEFKSMATDAERLKKALSGISYSIRITGKRIIVGPRGSEPDYGADVLQTFEKFKQGEVKEYEFQFPSRPDMNHVEAAILDFVAQLNPELFLSLDEYCARNAGFVDGTIVRFDREIQFYVAFLDHVERFKRTGLSFCYPTVSDQSKEIRAIETFDLALADKLSRERASVVTNDFFLKGRDRILVVSGPNQGGKTTFARTFGQIHYLASLGCPVPGSAAKLYLFDRLFTHFEREEDIHNLSGKLEDDLLRVHRILEQARSRSIIIMNESFLSTTLNDALFLSKQVMRQIMGRDILCVTVTFLDELASMSESTVSMVSTVNPEDPALRTFKVVRRPADGLAYAAAIAEKYGLTYERIKGRIGGRAKGLVAP